MESYLIITIGIVLIGIIIFIILARRGKNWRYDKEKHEDPIEHYKEQRDKLTHRKKKTGKAPEYEFRGSFSITSAVAKLVGFLISIYVFSQIFTVMSIEINTMNVTTTDTTSLEMMKSSFNFVHALLPVIALFGVAWIIISILYDRKEPINVKRSKKKMTPTEHYKKNRDKLTHREKETEIEENKTIEEENEGDE